MNTCKDLSEFSIFLSIEQSIAKGKPYPSGIISLHLAEHRMSEARR